MRRCGPIDKGTVFFTAKREKGIKKDARKTMSQTEAHAVNVALLDTRATQSMAAKRKKKKKWTVL